MPRANSSDLSRSQSRPSIGDENGRTPSQDLATIGEGGIPENDGMKTMREQLHEIRELAISTEEKARRMHELMTKDYATHVGTEPSSLPYSLLSRTSSMKIDSDDSNPYNLRVADLEPSFSPIPSNTDGDDALEFDGSDSDEGPTLGCMHYKRNVKIQCFDCRRWFPCRHCHDSSPGLPWPHSLSRKKTQNMLCMLCKTPQPAAEVCRNCGEYAAWYYCAKCKLWDNDSNKHIYHCDDCGLCRLGQGLGKDFVHCKRCNVCISIATSAAHPCIERATDSDCPLCLSYLFDSQTSVVSLPCGHYMHGDCYKDLMSVTYKCPVCNKSAINMELQWRKLDDEIEAQPMPEDDSDLQNLLPHIEGAVDVQDDTAVLHAHRPRSVWIGCNDCGARCSTPFHWLGLKCLTCGGYNTNQMAPLAGRESEAERLLRQNAQHRQHDFTGHSVMRDVGIGMDDEQNDTVLEEETGSRVDSAFALSTSPPATSTSPTSPAFRPLLGFRRASEAHGTPSRRYFLQAEETRRSSFNAPRFTAPSMPSMPQLPNLPQLPRMPDVAMPTLPHMPNLPNLPNLPVLPTMSSMELSRFSPYEMVSALSRSLSPMPNTQPAQAQTQTQTPQTDYRQFLRRPRWRNSAPPGSLDDLQVDAAGKVHVEQNGEAVEHANGSSASHGDHVVTGNGVHDEDDDDIFSQLIGHR